MKRTARGFSVFSAFKDSYGNRVRVQRSSSVRPSVWIFCDSGPHWSGSDGEDAPAPHLSPAQARRLIRALERFVAEAAS